MAGKRGKKEPPKNEIDPLKSGVHIIGAGEVVEQPIPLKRTISLMR